MVTRSRRRTHHISPLACRGQRACVGVNAHASRRLSARWSKVVARIAIMVVASGFAGMPARHAAAEASPPASCHVASKGGVPVNRLMALRRGFNLTGWLDHASGARPRRPSQALLSKLAGYGFSHVRLPLRPELVMPAFAAPSMIEQTLTELDVALRTLFAAGFAVSLDVHSDGTFSAFHARSPDAALQLLAGLWRNLAGRYADRESERLFFELLNEPQLDPQLWRAQAAKIIDLVRDVSPERTIVFGGARFSRHDDLISGPDNACTKRCLCVHFYEPLAFTHQGADWPGNDVTRVLAGVPFPSEPNDSRIRVLIGQLKASGHDAAAATLAATFSEPWTEVRIEREIASVSNWMARMKVPVIINEFGVLNWKVAPADRLRWLKAVRSSAESHCIGWAHWELSDAFGFVQITRENFRIDADAVQALLGQAWQ